MKSIVLCERTLVQKNEDFNKLKEESLNEERNEKKIFNGIPEGKKSESDVDSPKKDGTLCQNGNRASCASFKEEDFENDEKKHQSSLETVFVAGYLTSEADTPRAVARNSLSSDNGEIDCSVSEDILSENEIIENLEEQNSSEQNENSNLKNNINLSVKSDEDGGVAIQIKETGKSESSSKDEDYDSSLESFSACVMEEKELHNPDEGKNLQAVNNIILDMDENKENVKEDKTNELKDYSENDLSKDSDGCEIQVGEVQTMSGAEKESMWTESEQDSKEKSHEKEMYECQDISMSNDDPISNIGYEKEHENNDLGSDENVVSESEENEYLGMHIELGVSDQGEELKVEEKNSKTADFSTYQSGLDGEEGDETNHVKRESEVCRKRQIMETYDEEDPCAKKKRLLSEDREETGQSEEENTDDSSLLECLASPNTTGASSKGDTPSEEKISATKRTSSDEKTPKKLRPVSENGIKKESTVLSVLENFRGTLKTLTRSDLEELIVQKLCEVITERSNVGELRRKAQALEQDQERWKIKAQSLTKQMREMEMVMKKYMTEVQKQIKEGETHVVTPLKVTRSVGLQVSFYSSANKGPKPNLPAQPSPSSLPHNISSRNSKALPPPPPPKLPSQFSPVTQNIRNKIAAYQKSSPPLQKLPANQLRRPIAPKPDYNLAAPNRPVGQQSPVNNIRGIQNQAQIPRSNCKIGIGSSAQQQQQSQSHHQQSQQQQHQHHHHQNGSKVIDLTDDDDRQGGNVVVKTPGSIRVVNHLTQSPAAQNNRFAYLLPTSSASTGTSSGQSRQVLIATPTMPQTNRQIMCSMPPLLFKGGNVVQSSPQPHMLNQSNKVIIPKTLRHPAPLPKRPLNQNTRPSLKLLPPRPALKISKVQTGIVLSWNMALSPEHAPIASYQLYAYQESDTPPATSLWKKVGDVKALPLPMACTLTQFMSGHRYHFAVRAVDLHSRIGPFSFPGAIALI